jgi:hypothetical protein
MKNRLATLALTVLALSAAACESSSTTEPIVTPGATDGIRFTAGSETYAAAGSFSAANAAGVFAHEFAVARSDSLGGLVAVGYDADGSSGNLMIIQAPEAAGTYTCGTGSACHGRYITDVPVSGDTSGADRFFEISSGTLSITSISNGRLTGTFSGTLTASDQQPNATMSIQNGTIDVVLLADGATDGTLACMLSKVGMGGGC